MRYLRWSWLFSVIMLLACSHHGQIPAAGERPLTVDTIRAEIVARLKTSEAFRYPPFKREILQQFYHEREYLPLWHDALHARLTTQALQLRNAIGASDEHGLEPDNYHYPALLTLSSSFKPADHALLDILLTDAFLRYATHLYEGQTRPASVDENWYIEGDKLDALHYLESALRNQNFQVALARLAPPHQGYRNLVEALQRYRQIASLGGWSHIDDGPALRPGDRDIRVETLRWRLWAEGLLLDNNVADPYFFDAELEQAVRRFQRMHTLEQDGVIGRDSRAALNVPVQARIAQIQLNLERWRWLPRDLHSRHIMVNMAGFELKAYENDQPTLNMKVIIGKPFRSTPAFSGRLTHLVINPYWNVPRRIVEEDIIPAQIRDPDYLVERNIRVLTSWQADAREINPADISWTSYTQPKQFPYRLRQDPGPQNSLGQIKFMLANPFSIYLHDTPSRHLFQRTVRTFSSGCIRVEQPEALALFLFNGQQDWNLQKLRDHIESGISETQHLTAPVPVFLVYLTAWVDSDTGQLHFADDIYARDRELASRLSSL